MILLPPGNDGGNPDPNVITLHQEMLRQIFTPCSVRDNGKDMHSNVTFQFGVNDSFTFPIQPGILDHFLNFYVPGVLMDTKLFGALSQAVANAILYKELETVVYIIIDMTCAQIEYNYPILFKEFNLFTTYYNSFLANYPVRFLWTNGSAAPNNYCGMDQMVDDSDGMIQYVIKWWIDRPEMKKCNCPALFVWDNYTFSFRADRSTTLSPNIFQVGDLLGESQTEQDYGLCSQDFSPASSRTPQSSPSTSTKAPHTGNPLGVFSTIGISVVSLIALAIVFFIGRHFLCRSWSPWEPVMRRIFRRFLVENVNEQSEAGQPQNFYDYPMFNDVKHDKEWEIAPLSLQISSEKLGSGAYAVVFKGRLRGVPPVIKAFPKMQLSYVLSDQENDVAVKMTPVNSTEEERKEFLQEIEFMKTLKYYPHLLTMLGCSTDPDYPVLITELCQQGDLLHLLQAMNTDESEDLENKLELDDLVPIAWQVSDALAYLSQKNIIHRDVAARNVLITQTKMAKLSDFGLCRFNDQMFYTTRGGKLPIKWMAPESIEFAQFSTKSDVWSYGVFLFEEFSLGQTPYNALQPDEILAFLKAGNRLEIPEKAPNAVAEIIHGCFAALPAERLDFSSIRTQLYSVMETNADCYGYLQFSQQYIDFTSRLLQNQERESLTEEKQ